MICYAIRHIPSGKYLCTRANRRARGFTHDEPDTPNGPRGPRLFWTLRSVQNALNSWLRGEWIEKHEEFGTFDGYEVSFYQEIIPVSTRKKDEMEIVRFELKEL